MEATTTKSALPITTPKSTAKSTRKIGIGQRNGSLGGVKFSSSSSCACSCICVWSSSRVERRGAKGAGWNFRQSASQSCFDSDSVQFRVSFCILCKGYFSCSISTVLCYSTHYTTTHHRHIKQLTYCYLHLPLTLLLQCISVFPVLFVLQNGLGRSRGVFAVQKDREKEVIMP